MEYLWNSNTCFSFQEFLSRKFIATHLKPLDCQYHFCLHQLYYSFFIFNTNVNMISIFGDNYATLHVSNFKVLLELFFLYSLCIFFTTETILLINKNQIIYVKIETINLIDTSQMGSVVCRFLFFILFQFHPVNVKQKQFMIIYLNYLLKFCIFNSKLVIF